MRARSLSKVFRDALMLVAALPACGGQVSGGDAKDGDVEDARIDDAGLDALSADAGPTCDTTGKPKESDPIPSCGYQLPLVGDPALCGFDPTTHAGSPDECRKLCGHA